MRRLALLGLLILVLPACSQEQPDEPAPTSTSAATANASPATPALAALAIPDDFPLTLAMASQEHDDIAVSRKTIGMRALSFCGRKPLRGLKPVDRLAAELSGQESANTRDLMLFTDSARPAAVLADIREAASACPAEETGPGSRLLTEVRESSLGSPALTVLHTYEQGGVVGIGAEIVEVVQVGRALLVTSTYAEWDPATNLDEGVTDVEKQLTKTVAAMSAFRNEPESPGVPES